MAEVHRLSFAAEQLERIVTLRGFRAYRHLPPAQLAIIAALARPRRFRAGEVLFQEGIPVSSVHFILQGQVRTTRQGKELHVLSEHGVLGGLSALAEEAEGYQSEALTPTATLEVSVDSMQEIFEENFAVLSSVLRVLAEQILQLRRQLGENAGFPAVADGAAPTSAVGAAPLDLVQRIAFLRGTLPFAEGHLEAVTALAREGEEVRRPEGAVLWQAGEVSGSMLLIVRGRVHCVAHDPAQRFVLGPGDAVGSLDAVAGCRRWFVATTAAPCVFLRLEVQRLFDALEDESSMAMSLLRALARGLVGLQQVRAGVGPVHTP